MKKKILIITSILLIITVILSINLYNKSLKNNKVIETKVEDTNDESSGLAILVEDSDGNYKSSDTFPTEGYEFNSELSRCAYGGTVSWKDGKVFFSTSGSDMCYVYFDKYVPPTSLADVCPDGGNFVECIKTLQAKNPNQKETGIYFHDAAGTITPNGAKDDSYRYAGNNPDNFVCFGSEQSLCPEKNMYRIIGIFPFNAAGEQQSEYTEGMEYRVKLIKSEYITAAELGIDKDGTPITGSYTSLKRVKNLPSDGFYWNETQTSGKNWNDWETSTLKQALNSSYLSKLGTWANKIAPSTWYVSGHSTNQVTAKQMRDYEMNSILTVKNTKVGLMYASDYGYATTNDTKEWEQTLYNYDNTGGIKNRENNWLFNGVYEWLISPNSSDSDDAFRVRDTGFVLGNRSNLVYHNAFGVRPSFYLDSSTMISSDGNDGSHDHPYRLT